MRRAFLNLVFLAGIADWLLQVLRTRLRQPPPADGRARYTGLYQTLRLIMAEEGAAALYGGLTAHLYRVVPNAAIMYAIYEGVLRYGS